MPLRAPRSRPWIVGTAILAVLVAAAVVALAWRDPDDAESGAQPEPPADDVVLAVHGGAGPIRRGQLTEEQEMAIRDALAEALQAGHTLLQAGGSSIDAVEAAVIVLEDSPHFNAGRGAVFTADATHELDASIMDGADRGAGAVAVVSRIANPIALARLVMDRSPHVLLAGEGAERFAVDHGMELVSEDHFSTESRLDALRHAQQREQSSADAAAAGTVGAVAVDEDGDLAAATSTGGLTNKAVGRIGDSPIVGAATYADNAAVAVSTTGIGEVFIRLAVARDVAARMAYAGEAVDDAAEAALDEVRKLDGDGGMIALDAHGNLAMPFTTAGMSRGFVTRAGEMTVELYGD